MYKGLQGIPAPGLAWHTNTCKTDVQAVCSTSTDVHMNLHATHTTRPKSAFQIPAGMALILFEHRQTMDQTLYIPSSKPG